MKLKRFTPRIGSVHKPSLMPLLIVMVFMLCALAMTASAQAPARINVLIGFDRQPGAAEQALVHGAGGKIKYTYHLLPAMAVTIPETAVDSLRHHPHITIVEPDLQAQLVAGELDAAWGVQHIGAGPSNYGDITTAIDHGQFDAVQERTTALEQSKLRTLNVP